MVEIQRSLPADAVAASHPEPCNLLFIFDMAYLNAFKVFLFSLRDFLDEKKPNIVVLTNDLRVADDKFVQSVVKRIVPITADEIARLRNIPVGQKGLQIPNLAAFTFMKFFLFKDIGLRSFIYLDVDMISLRPDLDLTELTSNTDFAAAPTLRNHLFLAVEDVQGGGVITPSPSEVIEKVAARRFRGRKRINSGVCFVGPNMIGESTVGRLISMAETGKRRLEQQVLFDLVRESDKRFKYLPIWWNFTETPARKLGPKQFETFASRIKILHFNKTKPWKPGAEGDWLFEKWRKMERESFAWRESFES